MLGTSNCRKYQSVIILRIEQSAAKISLLINLNYIIITYVNGKDKKFFIHRLVLQTFKPVEDMDKLQVNHIDGDKQNNHVDNLEWCTQSENQKHAYKHGLNSNKGEHNPSCRLTEKQVIEIADLLIKSVPMSEIARRYGISKSAVASIREKRHWKYLLEDYNFPKYCSLK